MKISDFNKKPRKRHKKESTIFNLTNNRREEDLGKRINDLEIRLKTAHTEISNLEPFKGQYREASEVLEQKEGAINRLQAEFDAQSISLDTLRVKLDQLQGYKGQFEDKNNQYNSAISEVKNLKKGLVEGENQINSLKNDVFQAKNHSSEVEALNSTLNTDFVALKEGFNTIKSENDGLSNILTEIKEKYINTVKDNRTLELDCQTLLNDNRVARLKIEELDSFGVQLSTWNKKLTADTSEATSKSSVLGNKLKERGKVLTEMSDYIKTLIDDREDLIQLNEYLKFELKKPRFFPSTTVLSRKVGMPTSKENIRTEYLGTGTPTMLKFVVKEKANA